MYVANKERLVVSNCLDYYVARSLTGSLRTDWYYT